MSVTASVMGCSGEILVPTVLRSCSREADASVTQLVLSSSGLNSSPFDLTPSPPEGMDRHCETLLVDPTGCPSNIFKPLRDDNSGSNLTESIDGGAMVRGYSSDGKVTEIVGDKVIEEINSILNDREDDDFELSGEEIEKEESQESERVLSPLHLAVLHGSTACVVLLIMNGADPHSHSHITDNDNDYGTIDASGGVSTGTDFAITLRLPAANPVPAVLARPLMGVAEAAAHTALTDYLRRKLDAVPAGRPTVIEAKPQPPASMSASMSASAAPPGSVSVRSSPKGSTQGSKDRLKGVSEGGPQGAPQGGSKGTSAGSCAPPDHANPANKAAAGVIHPSSATISLPTATTTSPPSAVTNSLPASRIKSFSSKPDRSASEDEDDELEDFYAALMSEDPKPPPKNIP